MCKGLPVSEEEENAKIKIIPKIDIVWILKQKPLPAENFIKHNPKHNPKIIISKLKIWIKQENWASNMSISNARRSPAFQIQGLVVYKKWLKLTMISGNGDQSKPSI